MKLDSPICVRILDTPVSHRVIADFTEEFLPDIVRLGMVDFSGASMPMPRHIHRDCFEICCHCSGHQIYTVGSRDYHTHGGELFITFPNEEHGTGNLPEEKSSLFYLIFHCTPKTEHLMGMSAEDTQWIKNILWSCTKRVFPGTPEITQTLSDILTLSCSREPMRDSRLQALFVRFFYLLCRCIQCQKDARAVPEDIRSVMDMIDKNPGSWFSVSQLAARACLSESQLKRKFKQYTGFSPYDYTVRQKIDVAKEHLRGTSRTVTEISNELNFSSSQYFSTVFKKYTGMTPSEFKKSPQNV